MKIFIVLFLSLLAPSFVWADGLHVFPICFARGAVYLEVKPTTVDGYIGTDQVHFSRNLDQITGVINTAEVNLIEYRDNAVKGHVAGSFVEWTMNEKGTVIYGVQPCPAVVKW